MITDTMTNFEVMQSIRKDFDGEVLLYYEKVKIKDNNDDREY